MAMRDPVPDISQTSARHQPDISQTSARHQPDISQINAKSQSPGTG
jgi:hypothetical protein